MPPKQEIVSSLYGAWRLMRLDAAGMTYFNLSSDGFWRSFFAAVMIAPFYVALSYVELADQAEARAALMALDFASYCARWAAFVVVMIFIARLLQRSQHYAGFIIASNWISVPQWVLGMVVFAVMRELPSVLMVLLYVALISVMTLYGFYVARVALGVDRGPAIAIAVIGFLMSFLIHFAVMGLA